jgi:hypothetical protein
VSTPDTFWFHCGRCGSLFQSQPGDLDDRFCAKCGAKPSLGLEPPAPPPAPVANADGNGGKSQLPKRSSKSETHSNKSRNLLLKIIAGWSLLLVLIVLGARGLWNEEQPPQPTASTPVESAPELDQKDRKFLEDAYPAYAAVFSGFLAASTQEEQNQYVLAPATTVAKMARFYSANPLNRVNVEDITLVQQHILQLPGAKTVETLWKSKEGWLIDAVFRQEHDEWKLDWNHYARYSDHPWPLFLAGSGAAEGEFRLLARERLAEERKDAAEISMILYAPRFGNPNETGFQSPEFLVKRSTPDGKLLDAAFKTARAEKQVFHSHLANLNPDEMIRVRVKVRRFDEDSTRKFEVTRVIACHWYDIDDPGLVPAEQAAEPTGLLQATPTGKP